MAVLRRREPYFEREGKKVRIRPSERKGEKRGTWQNCKGREKLKGKKEMTLDSKMRLQWLAKVGKRDRMYSKIRKLMFWKWCGK